MAAKSLIFLRKTVVLTTWVRSAPAAAKTALIFSKTRFVCSTIPPSTICPVVGSRPTCPEANNISPTRTACEYGPIAAGASLVEITVLVWSLIVPQVYLHIDPAQIHSNRRDKPRE